jgi:hypothetical protein
MNYIISSIVLLAVIMIIIYILSIDNNADKFKNKIKELFSVAKSKKINYLNDKDHKNILNYIKQHFYSDDNVTIPSKIYYNKTDLGYEMNDIDIICYKYNNNSFSEKPNKINILFVPHEKDNYVSNQTLFGIHGNYMIKVINKEQEQTKIEKPQQYQMESIQKSNSDLLIDNKKVTFNKNDTFIPQTNKDDSLETYTDVLDMIPDIIHLSEDNSELNTTDTEQLISHNFK